MEYFNEACALMILSEACTLILSEACALILNGACILIRLSAVCVFIILSEALYAEFFLWSVSF